MRTTERIHSSILFPAVVGLLIVQPLLAALALPSEVLVFPFVAALVASLWSLDRRWFRVGLGLGLALVTAALAHRASPMRGAIVACFGSLAALSAMSVVLGVRWLFTSARITAETLLSAVSVYLLIGISFGLVYVGIYLGEPGAFSGVSPAGRSAEIAELVYFSIGTLSTSAFGDILPTHPATRLLANVEAVTGQLYIAVLVALLITGYTRGSRQE